MLKVRLEEIKNQLTEEQIEAIELCHNAYFYAEMSDDYFRSIGEKRQALTRLKTHFENLIDFIGDFYDCNDTLIFESEVK